MAVRSWGYVALASSALSALVSMGGCVDDGVSLHVICPVPPEIEDDKCIFSADSDLCQADGQMNVAATSTYQMYLRVQSGLFDRQREVPPQGEPNGLQLQGAEIEIRLPGSGPLDLQSAGAELGLTNVDLSNPYDVVATGYAEPGGFAGATLTAIDPPRGAVLKAAAANTSQVIIAVKLKGKTNGGKTIESGEFVWPVRLINVDPRGSMCRAQSYCISTFGQDDFAEACKR